MPISTKHVCIFDWQGVVLFARVRRAICIVHSAVKGRVQNSQSVSKSLLGKDKEEKINLTKFLDGFFEREFFSRIS